VVEVKRRLFEEKRDRERRKGSREESKDASADGEKEAADKKEVKSSPATKSHEKFYCVKLDGLPYLANNVAVKDFFEGLEIAQRGIHLIHNDRHQCTGIGYVEFVTSADCEKALKKNKEYMGKRFIIVEPITKRDMLDAMARDRSEGGERGRGRGRGGSRGGRDPSFDRPERTSRFTSERSFEAQDFSGGFDECRVHERSAYDDDFPQHDSFGSRGGGVTVGMYNVPFRANVQDIVDFFHGFPVTPRSVQVVRSADGRSTGEVNVLLPNVEEAALAVQRLDHQDLMGRTVELCIL
jgi:RNA recognition motif-containing protein